MKEPENFTSLQIENVRAGIVAVTGRPLPVFSQRAALDLLKRELHELHMCAGFSVPAIQELLEHLGMRTTLRELRNLISRR